MRVVMVSVVVVVEVVVRIAEIGVGSVSCGSAYTDYISVVEKDICFSFLT